VNRLRCSIGRSIVCAGVLLTALLTIDTASAVEPERADKVGLDVTSCPEAFESPLRRILVIELGELLDQSRPKPGTRRDSIQIACDSGELRVSARSAEGDQVVHNDLVLEAFPGDAAPRAAALAALEALRAVDPTLTARLQTQRAKSQPAPTTSDQAGTTTTASNAKAKAKPGVRRGGASPVVAREGKSSPATSPPAASPPAAPARTRLTRVLAGGVARFLLGDPRMSAFGARLELGRRFAGPWDAGLDVEGAFARKEVGLGTVEARLLSSAVWFGARAGGAWGVAAAAGGRFGVAELSGSPDALARGHRVLRPFGGPLLLVRGDGGAGPLAVALIVEGGLAAVGAEGLAGGTRAISLGTGWVTTSANVGVRF
jgi:hypothetical protein